MSMLLMGVGGGDGGFPAGTLYVDTLPLFVDTFYLTVGV